MVSTGSSEPEMAMLLAGVFEVRVVDARRTPRVRDAFGEVALLGKTGRLPADVVALTAGRGLAFRRKFLARLRVEAPAAASAIFGALTRGLEERLTDRALPVR
jgi:CRP-like cAMP-binding protein